MKKLCLLILVACLSFLCACSDSHIQSSITRLDDGSFYSTSQNGQKSYSLKTLPFEIEYLDKQLEIQSVSFYQTHSGHGYYGFVVASLNIGELSEDDYYWAFEEGFPMHEIEVNAYYRGSDSDAESENIYLLRRVLSDDSSTVYYVFRTELERYKYEDGSFSAQIIVAPDGLTEASCAWYHYDVDLQEDVDYEDLSVLSTDEILALTKVLLGE